MEQKPSDDKPFDFLNLRNLLQKHIQQLLPIVNALFSGDFRLLEFYKVPNTFFFISAISLFCTGGCDMCVHSRRECVPSLQEIDSHQAEMISTPIRVRSPPNISLLYRLDNTHSD